MAGIQKVIKFPSKNSFIITASIAVGCYRHIRIAQNATLENLSDAILMAFDFYDDHAHAFFMDNSAWSQADCYYCEKVDEDGEYRHTCNYRLDQVMTVGSRFKYVFDFGEGWVFGCKVLRELDGILTGGEDGDIYPVAEGVLVEFVREKGDPPRQYGDFDYDTGEEE